MDAGTRKVSSVDERATAMPGHAELLHGERALLKQIVRDAPLPVVLREMAVAMERLLPEALVSVLDTDTDTDGQHLRHGAAPSLPDFYNQAIDEMDVAEGVGSCGTAAHRRAPIIVGDIATEIPMRRDRTIALAEEPARRAVSARHARQYSERVQLAHTCRPVCSCPSCRVRPWPRLTRRPGKNWRSAATFTTYSRSERSMGVHHRRRLRTRCARGEHHRHCPTHHPRRSPTAARAAGRRRRGQHGPVDQRHRLRRRELRRRRRRQLRRLGLTTYGPGMSSSITLALLMQMQFL